MSLGLMAEQFISPDHHFLHLQGVAVFHKSAIPLWSNDFMVVSPHILVTVIELQLSFSPDVAFAQFTGCPYHPLVLLVSSLYGHLICAWVCDTVSIGCMQIGVSHILLWWVGVQWGLISSAPWASCSCSIIRISDGPGWTGRGASRFPPSLLSTGSSLQYQFGHVFVTTCRAVLTPNLYLWGTDVGPLAMMITERATGRVVPLFLWRAGSRLKEWVPHGECPQRQDLAREVWWEKFQLGE